LRNFLWRATSAAPRGKLVSVSSCCRCLPVDVAAAKAFRANGCGRRRIGAAARFGDGVPNAQTLSTRPPFARAEFANENGRMAAPAEW
jgi:hypothetical protein